MSAKKTRGKVVATIDKGATTVEEIHKSIAGLPLRIMEENDLLRAPAKEIRRFQERAIGAIYDVVRDVNQKVGALATDLLAKGNNRPTMRSRTAAKRHAPKHAMAHGA